MQRAVFPPAKVRRYLSAVALTLLAGLVIAGAWSATDAMRTAGRMQRSSTRLAELAKLRIALAEAHVQRMTIEQPVPADRPDRGRRMWRRLAREGERARADGAPDSLLLLLRERADAPEERTADLDRAIDRHARLRVEAESRRLSEASERHQTRGLQSLFAQVAVGLIAAGAAAAALRRHSTS